MGTILLVRHGQASFGQPDYDRLSDLGLRQAQVVGEALAARLDDLHVVASGTMKRHEQTARVCLEAMDREPRWRASAGWNEFDHEQVIAAHEPRYADRAVLFAEMKSAADPHRTFGAMFQAAVTRWTGGEHDADYTEPWAAFRERCHEAARTLAAELARGETALVFTSGGPIAAVCCSLLDVPVSHAVELNREIRNGSITRLRCGPGGIRLSSFNECQHLAGELLTLR